MVLILFPIRLCVACKIPFHSYSVVFEQEKKWKWKNSGIKQIYDSILHTAYCIHDDLKADSFLRTVVLHVMLRYSSRIETTTNVWHIHKNGIRISKTSNLSGMSRFHVLLYTFISTIHISFIQALGYGRSQKFSCYCHWMRAMYEYNKILHQKNGVKQDLRSGIH